MVLIRLKSLISAILLYRLKKTGFYLYLLSNLVLVILPYFYLKSLTNELIPIIYTLTMIGLWATQFKKLQ